LNSPGLLGGLKVLNQGVSYLASGWVNSGPSTPHQHFISYFLNFFGVFISYSNSPFLSPALRLAGCLGGWSVAFSLLVLFPPPLFLFVLCLSFGSLVRFVCLVVCSARMYGRESMSTWLTWAHEVVPFGVERRVGGGELGCLMPRIKITLGFGQP
jgi:hypothetical protein